MILTVIAAFLFILLALGADQPPAKTEDAVRLQPEDEISIRVTEPGQSQDDGPVPHFVKPLVRLKDMRGFGSETSVNTSSSPNQSPSHSPPTIVRRRELFGASLSASAPNSSDSDDEDFESNKRNSAGSSSSKKRPLARQYSGKERKYMSNSSSSGSTGKDGREARDGKSSPPSNSPSSQRKAKNNPSAITFGSIFKKSSGSNTSINISGSTEKKVVFKEDSEESPKRGEDDGSASPGKLWGNLKTSPKGMQARATRRERTSEEKEKRSRSTSPRSAAALPKLSPKSPSPSFSVKLPKSPSLPSVSTIVSADDQSLPRSRIPEDPVPILRIVDGSSYSSHYYLLYFGLRTRKDISITGCQLIPITAEIRKRYQEMPPGSSFPPPPLSTRYPVLDLDPVAYSYVEFLPPADPRADNSSKSSPVNVIDKQHIDALVESGWLDLLFDTPIKIFVFEPAKLPQCEILYPRDNTPFRNGQRLFIVGYNIAMALRQRFYYIYPTDADE